MSCFNCFYYSGEQMLPCAVNSEVAATSPEVGCRDWEPDPTNPWGFRKDLIFNDGNSVSIPYTVSYIKGVRALVVEVDIPHVGWGVAIPLPYTVSYIKGVKELVVEADIPHVGWLVAVPNPYYANSILDRIFKKVAVIAILTACLTTIADISNKKAVNNHYYEMNPFGSVRHIRED